MSSSAWHRQSESSYLLDEPTTPPNGLEAMETQSLLSSDEDDEALSLPSAGIANVRGETPEDEDNNIDIAEFDWGDGWGDADKEVNDALAESGDDAISTDSDNDRYFSFSKV
jgi:hypothetical protein